VVCRLMMDGCTTMRVICSAEGGDTSLLLASFTYNLVCVYMLHLDELAWKGKYIGSSEVVFLFMLPQVIRWSSVLVAKLFYPLYLPSSGKFVVA
jgi:hypothetical protein